MNYFPFFMDIEGRRAVIVGGGRVAARKVKKLLPYAPDITVIAEVFDPALERIPGIRLMHGRFCEDMLEDAAFVIVATNDRELNHSVSAVCVSRGIPVNTVDDRAACTFIFPALIKRGNVSIGISTGGASPSTAIYLRETFEKMVPDGLDEICAFLDRVRPEIKLAFSEECARAAAFKALFMRCMELGRPLSEDEYSAFAQGGFTYE